MTSKKRILLKLSGEALMGEKEFGLDQSMVARIAQDINNVYDDGYEISLVIGGGNIFRGVSGSASHGIDRCTSDYMGMLATVMNALAMQSALEQIGIETRVMSALRMQTICEPYIRRRAMHHLTKGRVVIFAAGSGHPFFTTDTAAALRASEMQCDMLLKGTKVDGVYDKDPAKHSDAKFLEKITFSEAIERDVGVMDTAALAVARENNMPLTVFSILKPGNLSAVLKGQGKCSIVEKVQK